MSLVATSSFNLNPSPQVPNRASSASSSYHLHTSTSKWLTFLFNDIPYSSKPSMPGKRRKPDDLVMASGDGRRMERLYDIPGYNPLRYTGAGEDFQAQYPFSNNPEADDLRCDWDTLLRPYSIQTFGIDPAKLLAPVPRKELSHHPEHKRGQIPSEVHASEAEGMAGSEPWDRCQTGRRKGLGRLFVDRCSFSKKSHRLSNPPKGLSETCQRLKGSLSESSAMSEKRRLTSEISD